MERHKPPFPFMIFKVSSYKPKISYAQESLKTVISTILTSITGLNFKGQFLAWEEYKYAI